MTAQMRGGAARTKSVKVEHILSALDQIEQLCGQVRTALGELDPTTPVMAVKTGIRAGQALPPVGTGCR